MDVLSKNSKLRMVEVDGFQSELRSIDAQNNQLRNQYMQLEDDAVKLIDHYKNAIDAEAEFLRREPSTMEQCSRRCQALNNMLATMKKLALVQDPSHFAGAKAILEGQDKLPPKVAPKPNSNGIAFNGAGRFLNNDSLTKTIAAHNKNEQLPPLPHSTPRVTSPNPIRSVTATSTPAANTNQTNANVLDSILDELNHTANSLPKMPGTDLQSNGNSMMPNGKSAKGGKQASLKKNRF